MIPKQDRLKPRTVEDLERMYNFKSTRRNMDASLEAANAAREAASTAEQNAMEAKTGIENKVDKTDDAQIITMINRSTDVIRLLLNRLVIESDNFSLSEEGKVVMSDATVKSTRGAYDIPVTTEIKEGTIVLEPNYEIQGEGEYVALDLLRFKLFSKTYVLQMVAYWAEDATSETGLRLTFSNFYIKEAS